MKNLAFLISLFLLVTLACSIQSDAAGASVSSNNTGGHEASTEIALSSVVTGTVNVRSCPSTTCGVVGYLYSGQPIEVLGCIGNWCEVVVEKKTFYVYAPCVGQGEGVCK